MTEVAFVISVAVLLVLGAISPHRSFGNNPFIQAAFILVAVTAIVHAVMR